MQSIRIAVADGRFRFTEHALAELEADNLLPVDAESALLTGTIVRVQPAERRIGHSYTVEGTQLTCTRRLGLSADLK